MHVYIGHTILVLHACAVHTGILLYILYIECVCVCVLLILYIRFLLGRHKVAMETYSEASALSPDDWVRVAVVVFS